MKKELKEKIVFISNADFGSSYGFGTDVYYMIKHIWKRKYLNKAIFRDRVYGRFDFDYNLIEKAAPLGNFFPRILTAIQLYSGEKIKTIFYDQKLFDYFAKRKIPKISNGILFSVLPNTACIEKSKELGYTTVLSTVYHPKWGIEIIKEEYSKYNLPINPNFEERIFNRQLNSLKNADYLLSLSEFTKNTFVDRGFDAKKIFVNPLGTNIKVIDNKPKIKNSKVRFLVVANAILMKGLQYLIEAWKNCKINDAELIICGNIPPETKGILLDDIKKIDNIKYLGFVSDPSKYYKTSSVFILTSLLEGMPRVVLDAMAFKLPVIATPIAAPNVKDGHDGIIVPTRDVKSLEKAIMYFYNNRDEIIRMGNNAANTVTELTWENYSRRLADIFEIIAAKL